MICHSLGTQKRRYRGGDPGDFAGPLDLCIGPLRFAPPQSSRKIESHSGIHVQYIIPSLKSRPSTKKATEPIY